MNLTIDWGTDCTTVRIEEPRLDAAMALPFKDRMREVAAKAAPVILVDMTRVAFMDSSGLGALIALHKTLPDGQQMQLSGLTPNVLRVFRLTRMDSVFTIRDAAADDATATSAPAPVGGRSRPQGSQAPATGARPTDVAEPASRAAGGGAG
ncbi:STAS domain-containing protein [uncultured Paracoccus sp.]|uniref:STAS domain-containing protein n=1 Tax=uncultured Paracoccus sp. TaxID=189685 RepID=UPI0034588BA6